MSKTDPMTRATVRNLPTAKRETPAERRARSLWWAKYEWRRAVARVKDAKLDAADWRAEIKELEASDEC